MNAQPVRIGRVVLPPLPLAVALTATTILIGFNLLDEVQFLTHHPRHTDFFLYYLAALIGRNQGWGQAYNPDVFLPAVLAQSGRILPYLNPPPLTWLVVPLSVLPYGVALGAWSALLVGSLLVAWRLSAPGSGLARFAHLWAALSLYVLFMGLRLGQVILVVVAGMALCAWLLRRNHGLLGGVALSVIVLKPQLAFLVPITLLLAGYWRALFGFALIAVPLGVLSAVAVQPEGIANFVRSAGIAHGMVGDHQVTIWTVVGAPVLATVGMMIAAAITLLTAFRTRGRGPELPIAAGIVGTMLVSPYVNGFDLAALILAGWLVLRLDPPRRMKLLLLAGFLELSIIPAWIPVTVGSEAVFMAALYVLASRPRPAVQPFSLPGGPGAKRVVVLPAYRAEKTLREVLGQISKTEVDQILLVDDASSDRTAELALELGIQVIKHPRNLGYGGNQKTCYANALLMGAEVVVMLHPDGQYDPGLVPALCRAVEAGKGDLVLGSRWLGLDPAAAGMPYWKRLGNRFLTWIENQVLGLNLSEYHTGYRAYSRRFLQTIPFAENSDDFVFDTQVLIQAAAFGFHVAEIPAVGRYFKDASSIGIKTSIVYGLKTLAALVTYATHRAGIPCRWLTPPYGSIADRPSQIAA
jgi:hypothetical protein